MALKIRILLLERKITLGELAEKLGTSSGNLNNKLRRDNFTEKDLIEIAQALDCDYEGTFVMRDTGKRY